MSEKWSPYREGENHLPDYPFIFNMNILRPHFDHPQILEEFLNKMVPEQFCYGFCWEIDRADRATKISFSYLAVKNPSIVTWLKLQTGVNPLDKSDIRVKLSLISEKWELQNV